MPRNSGTYSPPSGQPVSTGTSISSGAHNALVTDLGNEITKSLPRDGSAPPTANIPLGNFKVTGLGNGTAKTDAANVGQMQNGASQLLGAVSGADTIKATLTPILTAYASGQLFKMVAASNNTGAVTININAIGAKAVTKNGSNALVADDLVSGSVYLIEYDGTRFQVVAGLGVPEKATSSEIDSGAAVEKYASPDVLKQVLAALLPPGAVQAFAMNTAPSGWLAMDGTAVSRTTYADLFAAIGTTYGTGDGSTTFTLPDMRGQFARGIDNGRGVDTGRAIGSDQGFAIENIQGSFTADIGSSASIFSIKTASNSLYNTSSPSTQFVSSGGASGTRHRAVNFNASRVVNTADETRPTNVAFLYCIKT